MGKLMFVTMDALVLALALPASAQLFSINLTADNLSTIGIITDKDPPPEAINISVSGSVVYARTNANGLATVKFQGTANGSTRTYAFGAYEKDTTAALKPGWKSVTLW